MTGLRTLPNCNKRIRCLTLLLAVLQALLFFQPAEASAAEQGNERIYFEVVLPKDTGGADRIGAQVKLRIPEGMEVYGFSTRISVPMPYFECSNDSIQPGSGFSMENIGGMGAYISFDYENAYVPLTAGEYTLFTVQFTVRTDTPAGYYKIQTMTEEAYTSQFNSNGQYIGAKDVPFSDMIGSVYVGTLFAVTPEVLTLGVGQTMTVYGNKPISNVTVQDPQIASYSNSQITGLSVGSTVATFTADTNEQLFVRITVKQETVTPSEPTAITSNVYLVTGESIRKVPSGTTVSTFLQGFAEGGQMTVYRADGVTPMQSGAAVGTGCVVKLTVGGVVQDSKTVTVTGDVNGDGKVSAADYVNVKFAVLGKQTLTGVYREAADVNGDGKVSAADYVNIKYHVLGKTQITPR